MRSLLPALLLAAAGSVCAQTPADFPSRPIRFVLISSAGSGGDTIGRMLAERMGAVLKAGFVVENKPGAAGALATESVAKAPADGHTILLGGYTTHVLLPAVNPKLGYDPVRDFAPVGRVGVASILLVAANDFPAGSLKEFVAYAKANPGLQYGSWGLGSTGHFCGELLAQKKDLRIQHVPYKSVAQLSTDLLGAHIRLGFVDMASGSPLVKGGRLKALGACTSRSPSLPGVTSYEDEGIEFDGMKVAPPLWAVYAPAATPRGAVEKLGAALKAALEAPDVKARLLDLGVTASFQPGDELRESLKSNVEPWKQVARRGNISID